MGISLYCNFSTLVVDAMEYGITILFMSKALLLLFLRSSWPSPAVGMELDMLGVGLVLEEGVDGDEVNVGNDKLRALF